MEKESNRSIDNLERRIADLEVSIIEKNIGVLSIIKNITNYGFDNTNPEKQKASWISLASYLLRSRFMFVVGSLITTLVASISLILSYNSNTLLKQQNMLSEATRRSSYVFLTSNILDKVDEELKSPGNEKDTLSEQLISRIVAITYSLKPYYYYEKSELVKKPLSPERGQLLQALVGSGIDTSSLKKIYQSAIFDYSDLRDAKLEKTYLAGIRLKNADLTNVFLPNANLEKTRLESSIFINANLDGANLFQANFDSTNLTNTSLITAKLLEVDFSDANFTGAHFNHCSFINADIRNIVVDSSTDFSNTFFVKAKIYPDDWFTKLKNAKTRGYKEVINSHKIIPKKEFDLLNIPYYIMESKN